MIGHVFGLVGENISLLLTNQHLEEEAPIVEDELITEAVPDERVRYRVYTMGCYVLLTRLSQLVSMYTTCGI